MSESIFNIRKPKGALVRVRISDISENPYQPRAAFEDKSVAGLAQSIRECGLISPISVRRAKNGGFVLIAGERRLRATRLLGRNYIDAIIVEADEIQSRALSLIENIQREELNFFEEANALKELLMATGETQQQISKKLGRNPSTIANRLRLLRLPDDVKDIILTSKLSERHARCLLRLEERPESQAALAKAAAERGYTVKKLEALVERALTEEKPKARVRTIVRDKRMFINAIADTVKRLTGAGVNADYRVEEDETHINVIVSLPKSK